MQARKGANAAAPKFSLADGIDYGWLARVPELEPLSDLEIMLLSSVRLYHSVVKVRFLYIMLTTNIL